MKGVSVGAMLVLCVAHAVAQNCLRATSTVNLRTSPDGIILWTVPEGTILEDRAGSQKEWKAARYNRVKVWVHQKNVVSSDCSKLSNSGSLDCFQAKDNVHLRAGPSSSSASLGLIDRGEVVKDLKSPRDGFFRVLYQKNTYFVKGDLMEISGCVPNAGQVVYPKRPNSPSSTGTNGAGTTRRASPEPSGPSIAVNPRNCGAYFAVSRSRVKGNTKEIEVVKILRTDLTVPANFDASFDKKDNTMALQTACAWNLMRTAASEAGVKLTIDSGFRTYARQQYFWDCFQTKTCNNGLVAARPGFSRFGSGTALHISASDDYAWLRANGDKFNFRNTLPAVGKWYWQYGGVV